MSDNFKYKTEYLFDIYATTDLHDDLNISQASLDNLKPLIPKAIDLDRNVDLIGVAFNAAIVNKFNRNGDGIDSETAVDLIDYFIHKPTNIEHKKQKVVGHIVNAGFTDLNNEKIIGNGAALASKDPYYISLASVIYKTVNKDFADVLLRSSDENDPYFKKISASWELGFNDYVIAVGSQNLKDAEIISNPNQIEEMKKYLKTFEGSGALDDGTPIYRLVVGEVFPLGIGFTTNPAADVSGLVVEKNIDLSINDKRDASSPEETHIDAEKNIFKISQSELNTVKTTKTMDITEFKTEFEKILDSKLSDKAEFSEEAVANVASHVIDKIREKDEQFRAEREGIEAEKVQAQKDAEEAKASIEELQSKLEEATEKINSLETSINTAAAEELFNSRMESIDELYDLTDQDRGVLVSEIKALDSSDAAFEDYQSRLSSLLQHKSKAFKAEQEQQFEARIQEAVEQRLAQETTANATAPATEETSETVEDVVENVEVPHSSMANNNEASSAEEPLEDRFKKAFSSQNISITY
tara:strand:- start:3002 stop:4582 length:1581 start_codon:yes stop_codon:yes gene_type:complete